LLNLTLRVIWIPFFIFEFAFKNYKFPKDQAYLFGIAFMELFRRFVWNIFRLEYEHLNNRENYIAIRDYPLPMYPRVTFAKQESKSIFKKLCYCCLRNNPQETEHLTLDESNATLNTE
jgi:hypothetical protein